MVRLRIAQLANFVGPTSGGMKVAIEHLGRGYAEAGAERILVVPGPHDKIVQADAGAIVQIRAPRVSSTYRMIMQPSRALRALEKFQPTSVECSDKRILSGWAGRPPGIVLCSATNGWTTCCRTGCGQASGSRPRSGR